MSGAAKRVPSPDVMRTAADEASGLLKTLGHPGRLMILCHLGDGEKSVGEIAELVDMPQSTLSQHLARMRSERLVEARRESQTVYYRLAAGEVQTIMECLYGIYCAGD